MCGARTHHILGLYAGAGLGVALHWPLAETVLAAPIASLFAGGILSPDMDQFKAWRRLDRWLPDEMLGEGGPLQHRGITHWWVLPLAALCAVFIAVPHPYAWLAYAAIAGWTSHLAGDFFFGRASKWDHRGPGIPLWPWWGHVGVGLDSGGWTENVMAALLCLAPFGLAARVLLSW